MILTMWANQARVEQAREQGLAEGLAEARVERAREQGRAEGRAEARWRARRRARAEARLRGRAEENRRWQEYLDRRAAAERAGLPFTEPRPEPPEPFHDDR